MSTRSSDEHASGAGHGLVKSPMDFAGGIFLIALAALGFAGGFSLPFGTLSGIGSGLIDDCLLSRSDAGVVNVLRRLRANAR